MNDVRTRFALLIVGTLAIAVSSHSLHARPTPIGTAFTYQGQLKQAGAPAEGVFDLEFRLFATLTGGTAIGTLSAADTTISEGLFTIDLDFGASVFDGDKRWLEITVEGTTLNPRQPIMPVPYALFALNGNEGPIGPAGPAGPTGAQGPPGATGAIGPQGTTGATGATGPQGALGAQGPQGEVGSVGPIGPTGPQGPDGAAGDSHWGLDGTSTYYMDGYVGIGEWSPSRRLHVADDSDLSSIFGTNFGALGFGVSGWNYGTNGGGVEGIANNSSATASAVGVYGVSGSPLGAGVSGYGHVGVRGTSSDGPSAGYAGYFAGRGYFSGNVGVGASPPAHKLDVAGTIRSSSGGYMFPDGSVQTSATLQGAAGPQGATGPQGAMGPQGPQGATGAAGATGPQGNPGPIGATGPQGAQGNQGPAGAVGPQGPSGVVAAGSFSGGMGNFTPTSAWTFYGPTNNVTVAAGQKLFVIGSAALGTTTAGGMTFLIDVGYQLQPAGPVINFSGGNYMIVKTPVGLRNTWACNGMASGLTPGTYKIGLVIQANGAGALNDNDYGNLSYQIFTSP